MILPKLKQATREHHLALESQMPILDPLLSLETYQALLRKFHGYYAPLEMQMLSMIWWDEIDFSYTERFKTPRLVRDLMALGDTPETIAALPFVMSYRRWLPCPTCLVACMSLKGQRSADKSSPATYKKISTSSQKRVLNFLMVTVPQPPRTGKPVVRR